MASNLLFRSALTSINGNVSLKFYVSEASQSDLRSRVTVSIDGAVKTIFMATVPLEKTGEVAVYTGYTVPFDKMVKLEVEFNSNGVYSDEIVYVYQHNEASISNRPVAGSLRSLSEYTPTSIGFIWQDFKATYQYSYEYSFEEEGTTSPAWVNFGTGTSLIFTGLKPETVYTFRVRVKDVRGYYSDTLSRTVQTDSDQVIIGFNQSGKIKKVKLYVNVGGKIRKVKKIYKNEDGKIKTIKSL